jgi:2-amino-4-hydroxy-6-hydroxymethyldihydropteridine diphosphokinase
MTFDKVTNSGLETVYLSLGSNIGPRRQRLASCLERLGATAGITVEAISSVYESEAEEMAAGAAAFLNQVIRLLTEYTPEELLLKTESLERDLERTSKNSNTSRTIDIDILLFGEQVISTESLTVPHPRLHRRAFALIPLLELDMALKNPNTGQLFSELLEPDLAGKVTRINERTAEKTEDHTKEYVQADD